MGDDDGDMTQRKDPPLMPPGCCDVTQGLGIADRVALFHAMMPIHHAFCIAGLVMSLSPIIFAPSVWFANVLVALFFVLILVARWSVTSLEDQARALHLFGLQWVAASVAGCLAFVVGNILYGLCTGVPSAAVYTLACMTALVPVYLQLSGVSAAQRLANNLTIAGAFYVCPQWSAMPHNLSSLIMWLALIVGEMVGAHVSSLIFRWIQTPSALRGAPSPVAPRVARDGAPSPNKRGPDARADAGKRCTDSPCERGSAAGASDTDCCPTDARKTCCPTDRPQTVKEMLRCFACRVDFQPELLRMHWPTLCFDDQSIEVLYAANSLMHSRGMHSIAATAVAAVCATGSFLSPPFRPLGLLAGLWTALIWRTHRRVQSLRDSPLAYLRFCDSYTRLSLLFGAVFLSFSIIVTRAGLDALAGPLASPRSMHYSPGGAGSPPLLMDIGLRLRATSDPVGVVCSCLLLMLAGAHHGLVVLPPAQRVTNRVIILVGVFASHSSEEREQLLPSAPHSFILAACVLSMGELIGFSVDHVRRSLFRDWVLELYAAHRASLQAAADLRRMAANAMELERKNASNKAEMAADKRLNHVIKGRCGSAISAVETFRQLLSPYLKRELPDEMSKLIGAPLSHLREAIEWCHRRQVFVQLEEGSYVSRSTPVYLNPLLEESLANSGTLSSNVDGPIALDVTVLRISLDEIISNALKYRRHRTPLQMVARFSSGTLHVEVRNINPVDVVPLSADDLQRVLLPGYKAHTCSVMSDGLGLDSVSKAVGAARGAVRLEQDATCTTAHISLPASLRTRSQLDAHPAPEDNLAPATTPVAHAEREERAEPLRGSPVGRGSTVHALPALGASVAGWASGDTRGVMTRGPSRLSGLPTAREEHGRPLRRSNSSPALLSCAAAWPASAPRCIGLTDSTHSLFLAKLFTDHIRSPSCMLLSASPRQCLDLLLGRPNGTQAWHARADIVVLSHTLVDTESAGRSLPGAHMAQRLREHGYAGLICLVASEHTSRPTDEIDETPPAVDFVIQPNSNLEEVSARLLHLHAANRRPSHRAKQLLDRMEPRRDPTHSEQVQEAGDNRHRETGAPEINLPRLLRTGEAGDGPHHVPPPPPSHPTTPASPDGPTAAMPAEAQPTGPDSADQGGAVAEEAEIAGAAAPRSLRVCALDDESIPRMIQTLLIKHHLHASLDESCALGATEEEMRGFVEVALGRLHSDLSPNLGLQRQADVVILDENIRPPEIMGSKLAGQLREQGFAGVTVVLTGASASGAQQIRALPAVDLVFEKGHPLTKMAEEVFQVLERRRPAAGV